MGQQYTYNKKVSFNYKILEKYEAGIKLQGFEVKAVKKGLVSLQGSFVKIKNGEAILSNMHIGAYQKLNMPKEYNETRDRKLLLHKKETEKLTKELDQKGLTIVPLKLYNKGGLIKVELALAKGKKKYDKRETIKKKEDKRKMDRSLKQK